MHVSLMHCTQTLGQGDWVSTRGEIFYQQTSRAATEMCAPGRSAVKGSMIVFSLTAGPVELHGIVEEYSPG